MSARAISLRIFISCTLGGHYNGLRHYNPCQFKIAGVCLDTVNCLLDKQILWRPLFATSENGKNARKMLRRFITKFCT